jgi:hypothetical protein
MRHGVTGTVGELVALEDRHRVGSIRNDASRRQAGDAGTDDDHVHRSIVSGVVWGGRTLLVV